MKFVSTLIVIQISSNKTTKQQKIKLAYGQVAIKQRSNSTMIKQQNIVKHFQRTIQKLLRQ